jgi:hypothetical protein
MVQARVAGRGAHVVERGAEAGHVFAHLDARRGVADLVELLAAAMRGLAVRGAELEGRVPRAQLRSVEARAAGRGMAERGHDDARVRHAHDPLALRQERELPELRLQAVVRPALELDHRRDVLGTRDASKMPTVG